MSIQKISKLLVRIFGSRNERLVKSYSVIAEQAGRFEQQIKSLNDEKLKNKTTEFKSALAEGASPEDILPEAFAVVREAARRKVNMRHFDVQLIGGNVLYDGKIAEMATGEGKTLVATLASYLVHLTGRRIHIITVNDYLAKRDAEWMSPVYQALGMTVGAIQSDMDTAGQERRQQYESDICYGTNNEFGFDYLRDNMKVSMRRMVQSRLQYAIVDEVDSILIDEARTPLIISGPALDRTTRDKYFIANDVAKRLMKFEQKETSAGKEMDLDDVTAEDLEQFQGLNVKVGDLSQAHGTEMVESEKEYAALKREMENVKEQISQAKEEQDYDKAEKLLQRVDRLSEEMKLKQEKIKSIQKAALLGGGKVSQYFEIDHKAKRVTLTERGVAAAQKLAKVGSFYTGSNMEWPHLLEQALRAHLVYKKEKDYVVVGNTPEERKVVIVDEFTGRLMHGRQWSDGLHQAVEAKENVPIKEETQTLATITLQNFFKLYEQIAGMTGTAMTEEGEFKDIYQLEVVSIPQNKPCIREDREDMIYKTREEKLDAVVEEIETTSRSGRPVLVGTTSVERNVELVDVLKKRYGKDYRCELLNAKNHAREADIVAQAGCQHKDHSGKLRGNVTITTNMAGRGTDIKLAPEVLFDVVAVKDSPDESRAKMCELRQHDTGKTLKFKSTDPLAEVFQIDPGQKVVGGLHVLGTERHEARRIDNQLRGRCGRQGDPGSSIFFVSFKDDLMKIFAPESAIKALSWMGWKKGQPIYHPKISKSIEKAQKKVEQRNFEIRKSLLEYDQVMDSQRKIFYSRRRQVLAGKGLKEIVWSMIAADVKRHRDEIINEMYPVNCVVEWARSNFAVELKVSDVRNADAEKIEQTIKQKAQAEARNTIELSVDEYLEDYGDPRGRASRDISGLCKWAAGTFEAKLTPGKIKDLSREEIKQKVIEASAERIEKLDYSELREFLDPDFSLRRFADWIQARLGLALSVNQLKQMEENRHDIYKYLADKMSQKYRKLEIEYPVDFVMSMVYQPQGTNVYAFQKLADWAKKKYNADFSAEQLQNTEPLVLRKQLLELSRSYNEGRLEEEINDAINTLDTDSLKSWAEERFEASLSEDELTDEENLADRLTEAGREFLRKELSSLEKYVLLHVYDGAWKDHLYAMDHLRDSIWMRSMAEKDPKVEYKREGFTMFEEMLKTIDDRVTDMIFKIRLEAETQQESVYKVSQTAHDEVSQFALAERQRAAAQAPQGEVKVKQIKLEGSKVGRNDPCPCGSGKKYKKCCGKNA